MPGSDPRPIGMFDSGVGGLSVLREVRRLLPHENVIYFADQAHLPYGVRPRNEIRAFAEGIARFLIDEGCKILVVACNAANAAALHYLRELFPDTPIVGMEPAIKPAARDTRTGVIGVITTMATFQGELFASVIDRFASGVRVETQVCPEFVTLVEHGVPNTPDTRATIRRYLEPLKAADIDQLVIGCTHFPFLEPYLHEFFGPDVQIVDPAPAVARQVGNVLGSRGLTAPQETPGTVTYITSHQAEALRRMVHRLLGTPDTQPLCRFFAARWDGLTLTPIS